MKSPKPLLSSGSRHLALALILPVLLLFVLPARSIAKEGPAFSGLSPVLECVVNKGYGAYTAFFGYNNESGVEVAVPVGASNQFAPAPADRSQPRTFAPGRHFNVFSVDFDGSNLVWKLEGRTATASSYSPACKSADLSLDKKVDDATPDAGAHVTFTVKVTNSGPNNGYDVVVADELPAGLTYVSHDAGQGTYDKASGTWDVGTVAINSTVKLTVTAKVTATWPVVNTAEVVSTSRLDPDSTPGNGKAGEDDQDSVTVTPKQQGGEDAVCYVVADDVDTGGGDGGGRTDAFFVINPLTGAEQKIGHTGTLDTEAIEYDNESGTLYAVDGGQLGVIDLTTGDFTARPYGFGSGKGAEGPLAFDDVDGLAFDPTSGILYGSVRRLNKADLLIQIDPKTGKAVPNAFGSGVDYVVIDPIQSNLPDIDDLAFDADGQLYGTANNDGLEDRLVEISKQTGDTWDRGRIKKADGTVLNNFEAFTSNPDGELIGIRGGAYKEIYRIAPGTAGGTAKATYLSTLSQASDYEALTCNVRPSAGTQADLELTKTVDDDKPFTGGNATFTITVLNKGPHEATGVDVRDKLPYALTYAQHHASQGSYDPSTGLWKVGSLDVWASATLKIVVQVKPGTYDPVTNTAEVVHADQEDPDSTPGNNDPTEDDQDSVTLTPRPHDANLCIQKWVDNPAPKKGDEVTFFIKVCNDPADFTDIVVVDKLPDGLWFLDTHAEDGWASYDDDTRKVTWEIPELPFGETTTLKIRVIVDTDYSVENCAKIVQSTPPDHPGDNTSCAAVTPGQSSGGGDAGVESDGNLATKLARRLYHRRQDTQLKRALRAAPEPVLFSTGETVALAAGKTVSTNLGTFIPETGPQSTNAYVVTPADLLGITNATSLFAADYLRPEGRRLAALFGATSPAGVLYDHAKATCDRLGGGRLEAVRTIEVDGHTFVLSRLIHPNGATDYSVSFVAYQTDGGLTIDSRFATSEYEVPGNASEVINLQVWSVAPEYTAELVSDILELMGQQHELTFLNTPDNAPAAPDVFVQDGRYAQGKLALRVVNRSGAGGTVRVRGTAARTEVDAEQGRRVPFEYTVALPAPADDAALVSVEVEVGPIFDATFEVDHPETGSYDQLYYADGPWSYAAGDASAVAAFATTAHEEAADEIGRYVVERAAQLSGQVSDWASLFRYLRPGGQPVDLSAYEYVEFFARGTGQVQLVLEKASIDTWDQYTYAFPLRADGHTYRIYFDEFVRAGGAGGFTAEDVTMAAFYVVGNGQARAFDLQVEGLAFAGGNTSVGTDEDELPSQIALGQNYPNPFNPATTIDFELPEAMPARLAVYDLLGREVALLADGVLTAGRHQATFEAGAMPSGTYLYRLVTPHRTLTGKMVLMK